MVVDQKVFIRPRFIESLFAKVSVEFAKASIFLERLLDENRQAKENSPCES